MNLIYTPDLLERLRNSNLLIDTCVLIDASKCEQVNDFLMDLSGIDCALLSLPSVRDEFTCSANSTDEYERLLQYIDTLGIIFLDNLEKRATNDKEAFKFNIALMKCKRVKNPSYVDRMLMITPYLYRDSGEPVYLMTSNYKDVPREMFDLLGFISYDMNAFHNIGIYEFNQNNFLRKISNT